MQPFDNLLVSAYLDAENEKLDRELAAVEAAPRLTL